MSVATPAIPQQLQITVGSTTEVGGRQNNEDAVLVRELPAIPDAGQSWLLAVADGMGGLEAGELASGLAIEHLADAFDTGAAPSTDTVVQTLTRAYRAANAAIYEQSRGDDDSTMGTTLVAAVILGRNVTIANVGDSRAYLMRSRQLLQLTKDHSMVAEQMRQNQITADEARRSPQRNILTQTVGTRDKLDKRMPEIYEFALEPEDRLLLCSDGFFDVLQDDDYLQLLSGDDPDGAARSLATTAVERNTTDNVSAVVVSVGASRATIQREELRRELAEQHGESRSAMLIPAIIIIVLLIAIIAGIIVFL